MPLTPYACANCGFWQKHFDPPHCPICSDPRNDLPEDGWRFVSESEARATMTASWRVLADDLVAFSSAPPLGLDGYGWLILREAGNIAFEAAPFYTDAALSEIERLGGVAILAASHPHGYGALWQLQDAFQPDILAIHKDDLPYTKAFTVTWPYDDRLRLTDDLELIHVGGHYAGQAALHDARGRRLFCGDMLKVDQDKDGRSLAISAHKAFHKSIPLTTGELAYYRERVAPLDFDAVLTPFEYAPDVGRDLCVRFFDEQIRLAPGVRRYPVAPQP